MKAFLLSTLGLGLGVSAVHAQDISSQLSNIQNIPASSNVYGRVVDTISNGELSLEWGSAQIISEDKTSELNTEIDSTGHFTFNGIKAGNYNLIISFPGFPDTKKVVNVKDGEANLDLGAIYLATHGTEAVKEVTITGLKQLVQSKPDGIIYNAENDITNKGGNAADVLRKTPLLTVDLEGNVQMRGNSNIRVFINNKPSTLIAASVSDALKQIPADEIKSVEVITNPGAKYDAEGSAGIINITTKSNAMKGLSGTVFSAYSYRFKNNRSIGNIGGNISYNYKKFSMNLSAGVNRWALLFEGNTKRVDNPGTAAQSILSQSLYNNGAGNFGYGRLNTNYQLDSLQSVSFGINYNPGKWNQDQTNETQLPSQNIDYVRNIDQSTPRQNVGLNAGYSKKFKDNPKHTLDFLGQYSFGNSNSQYNLNNINLPGTTVDYREYSKNKSINNELTLQADYVQPLKGAHNQKIETGAKYINRYINSNYLISSQNDGEGAYVVDGSRTNQLKYTQQVAAVYGQYSRDLTSKLSAVGGMRYEYTNISANLRDGGGNFGSNFNNFVPNVLFSYNLGNFNILKLAYNLRIERPSIQYVNPYVSYADPYNLTQGNPDLKPEKTHNIELGYSTYLGKSSINLSTFYSYTGNGIDKISTVDANNVSHTNYGNIDKNNTWGTNLFVSTNLFDRWMINASGNLYYKNLKSPSLDIKNTGWQYDGNIYTSFRLSSVFSLAGFAMYNGNNISLQGKMDGWYYYFVGAQAQLFKGKATLMVAGENIFSPKSKMTFHYTYGNSKYDMTSYYYAQGVKVSLSFNFGKVSYGSKSKSVKNDDLKSGESSSPGGMSGQN